MSLGDGLWALVMAEGVRYPRRQVRSCSLLVDKAKDCLGCFCCLCYELKVAGMIACPPRTVAVVPAFDIDPPLLLAAYFCHSAWTELDPCFS